MIRLAKKEDLNIILDIYAYARSFMASTGNPNQWINNYPGIDILSSDIDNKQLYVCYNDITVIGRVVILYTSRHEVMHAEVSELADEQD